MLDLFHELEHFQKKRWLVCIRRTSIDSAWIQGYIRAVSPSLVLIHYVRDFQPDGYLVIPVNDIRSVRSRKTDQFHHQIMEDAGVLTDLDWDQSIDLTDWRVCLSTIVRSHRVVVIEEEAIEKPGFTIGTVCDVEAEHVVMRHFSGAGRWLDELEQLDWSDVTCCQFGSRYIRMYVDYFDKHGLWPE